MQVLLNAKVWDRTAIETLLAQNDEAVGRALMVVYANQTADEKSSLTTRHVNGKGFTSHDAAWLTDIAVKWQRWRRWASPKQCNAVRRAIGKYHRQLLQHLIDAKGGQPITKREVANRNTNPATTSQGAASEAWFA